MTTKLENGRIAIKPGIGENMDYTGVKSFTVVNNAAKKERNKMHKIIKYNNGEKEITVITTKQVAEAFNTTIHNIKMNYSRNKERFIEGIDYFKLNKREISKVTNSYSLGIPTNVATMYIWTERGVLKHMKMIGSDEAWEGYDMLLETYFKAKELTAPTEIDLIIKLALSAKEIQQRLNNVEGNQKQLEGSQKQLETKISNYIPDENYSTISAYCSINKIKILKGESIKAGKKIKKKCDDENREIKVVSDVKYGMVNSYPNDIIERYFTWLNRKF